MGKISTDKFDGTGAIMVSAMELRNNFSFYILSVGFYRDSVAITRWNQIKGLVCPPNKETYEGIIKYLGIENLKEKEETHIRNKLNSLDIELFTTNEFRSEIGKLMKRAENYSANDLRAYKGIAYNSMVAGLFVPPKVGLEILTN